MQKRIALVTGASRGIGRAVAAALAQANCHVVVNFRSREDEAAITLRQIEERGGTGELAPFDVGDGAACEQAIGACLAKHGAIDVLVNNAGIRKDQLLIWTSPQDWGEIINTDLNSFYHVTRPVVRDMLLKRRGRIITISSTSGLTGVPGQVGYSAAKAGLIGASKSLARECAKRGVTVNVLCPGFIETEILEGADREALIKSVPMERLGKPEEVAAAVVFLAGEMAGYITGAVLNINGGIYT
jgi:3-oxoacyl-[acyl-carrier protein] reductase